MNTRKKNKNKERGAKVINKGKNEKPNKQRKKGKIKIKDKRR